MSRPGFLGFVSFRPALLTVLRQGYTPRNLTRDMFSGVTVGIVALPLAMAFAIASGASPERGLFTAIVAGLIISLLGGSRYQIGGPTGAFVIIISNIIARHGYEGLVLATLMAGGMLVIMGLLRFGKLLQFIPYPVTTGFTAGIGLLIFSSQLKDFFGLGLGTVPVQFPARMAACFQALPTLHSPALGIGLTTLAVMILVRRFVPRIPAHFMGIVAATLLVWALGLDVETIGTRFGGIPATLPGFQPPSGLLDRFQVLLPDALTIALLAGIESLLSAVVADGMTGERHDSSAELVAQGLANIGSVLFGGIPATGAIARTATNIRAGAFSPISGVVHSLTLAAFMLVCAPLASRIPLASLAAVLMVVAWDMSEAHRFRRLLRAPKSDSVVLLATFLLTVFVDLTVAVQVGVVMAAMLFMKRMSELSSIHPLSGEKLEGAACGLRDGRRVMLYEIDGPFFFGMAQRFIDVISFTDDAPEAIILGMRHVPSIDATGMESLELVLSRARTRGVRVLLSGVNERVRLTLRRMGTKDLLGRENVFPDIDSARAALAIQPPTPGNLPPLRSTTGLPGIPPVAS